MKKKKAKDGIVVNAGNGNYIPNIVRGGAAIPIGKKNFYYMQGRKHEQGGIDVGRNPKTGLEVEGEEVMQVTPKEVRVYSSVPFLRGVSPAELVLNGADANKVFAAQEKYKDNNRINDDGTKYRIGGEKDNDTLNSPYEDPTFTINRKPIDLRKDAGKATNLNISKKAFNAISKLAKFTKVFGPVEEFIQYINPSKENEYYYNVDKYNRDILKNNIDEKKYFEYGGNINKNISTNQNDFLDSWNTARLATGRYNNQLGDGRLERQAKSRNTAREFHSPIGFAMNYGKQATIRTPSMSDIDYRKEIARNAQNMKLRLNNPETGQGVIGGAYHAPTHSSYINQEEFAKDPTVRTHENTHASKAVEQEQTISNIIGSNDKSDYLRRPTEIYSRLMQFRQANNIDPNTVYDKNSFKELKKNAIDYNLINTFKDEEVIDLLNNVAMSNDSNKINLNNYNLNNVPVYMAKYGTKQKCKMGKLVSINGNVKNGLIHTPNQDVLAYNKERKPRFNGRYSKPGLHNLSLLASALILPKGTVNIEEDKPVRYSKLEAHNRLVTADTSQKPLYEKNDNTTVAHTISETERRTRKFVCGGRSKAKVGKGFRINNDKYNIGDTITYKDKQYIVTDRNEAKPIDKNVNSYVDGIIGAARRVPTSPQLTRNITNGLVNNAPTYKKNGETHYFVEAPKVDYDSGTNLADLQNLLNLIPRKGTNQSNSSSTGGVNNRTAKSTKSAVQRVNGLAPATNAEMAGIRRGLEPLLQNTVVDKLNKNVDNDLNAMPVQDDIAKTRNMDNILLGVNLGSSVLDAVMGNIYANQMHGYNAPEITAPTISNPGEIKLNEEDLKDIPAPILMAAAKLKTRYNANPQLSKIEDETRRIMGEIDRNTSNSRVALARKQRAALQGQQAKNEVYGRKENIETELINKDKLNQQEVTARNLARYDQYNQALAAQRANRARLRLAADTANIQNKLAVSTANAQLKSQADRFNATNRINQLVHQAGIDAAKAEARSSIFSGMLGNIGSALNTWNRNKRQAKLDEETLRVLGLLAPNANKLVLSALGY